MRILAKLPENVKEIGIRGHLHVVGKVFDNDYKNMKFYEKEKGGTKTLYVQVLGSDETIPEGIYEIYKLTTRKE